MELSNKACEEFAEILITLIQGLPDHLVSRNIKRKAGASHSLLIASVMKGKEEWAIALGRLHYWIEQNNIDMIQPPENVKSQE